MDWGNPSTRLQPSKEGWSVSKPCRLLCSICFDITAIAFSVGQLLLVKVLAPQLRIDLHIGGIMFRGRS